MRASEEINPSCIDTIIFFALGVYMCVGGEEGGCIGDIYGII